MRNMDPSQSNLADTKNNNTEQPSHKRGRSETTDIRPPAKRHCTRPTTLFGMHRDQQMFGSTPILRALRLRMQSSASIQEKLAKCFGSICEKKIIPLLIVAIDTDADTNSEALLSLSKKIEGIFEEARASLTFMKDDSCLQHFPETIREAYKTQLDTLTLLCADLNVYHQALRSKSSLNLKEILRYPENSVDECVGYLRTLYENLLEDPDFNENINIPYLINGNPNKDALDAQFFRLSRIENSFSEHEEILDFFLTNIPNYEFWKRTSLKTGNILKKQAALEQEIKKYGDTVTWCEEAISKIRRYELDNPDLSNPMIAAFVRGLSQ